MPIELVQLYQQTLANICAQRSIPSATEVEMAYALESRTVTAQKPHVPHLVVISGISGSGKTTSLQHIALRGYSKLLTVTTRAPRTSETDADAVFVDQRAFDTMVQENKIFYPHERNGVMQGIRYKDLEALRNDDIRFYTDRSVASTQRLSEELTEVPHTYIYILPPSIEILYERIMARESSADSSLNRDAILERIKEEIADMALITSLPYIFIVNDTQERVRGVLNHLLDVDVV